MPKESIIPITIGVIIVMGITEYNRWKMARYYADQNKKNEEEIAKLYKRYVR